MLSECLGKLNISRERMLYTYFILCKGIFYFTETFIRTFFQPDRTDLFKGMFSKFLGGYMQEQQNYIIGVAVCTNDVIENLSSKDLGLRLQNFLRLQKDLINT